MRKTFTGLGFVAVLAAMGLGLTAPAWAQVPPVPVPQTAAKAPSAPKAPAGPGCIIAEFRTIGLSVHNPLDRYERAWNWLRANARRCSLEQLQTVNNNRASWLGSSDSPEIMGFVDAIIEFRTQGDEKGLAALYNSKPVEAATTTVTTGLPERPAPVVQPGVNAMPNGIYIPQPLPQPQPVGGMPQGPAPGMPGYGQARPN